MGLIQKLTDIATAISDKTGKPASEYTLDEMPNAIRTIQTEFPEIVEDKPKVVVFYDYDGSVVANFSYEELEHLTQLPELPTHEGLIATGWSSNLEEVKSVEATNRLYVGVMYSVPENPNGISTVLYLKLPKEDLSVTLRFKQTIPNGVKINWGDGSDIETVEGTDNVSITHTYTESNWSKANVVLTLTPDDGCILSLGQGTQTTKFFSNNDIVDRMYIGNCVLSDYCFYQSYVKNIFLSNYISIIPKYCFYQCYALLSIIIPNSVTIINDNAFNACYCLEFAILPNSISTLGGAAFGNNFSLKAVSIPNTVTTLSSVFSSCYSLTEIIIPNNVTTLGSTFQRCYSLKEIIIPNNVKTMNGNIFYECYSLSKVTMPEKVTTFQQGIFTNCQNLKKIRIPSGATAIDMATFSGCYSLKEMIIPNSATRSQNSFSGLYNLEILTFEERTNRFPNEASLFGANNVFKKIDLSKNKQVITLSGTIPNLKSYTLFVVPDELYDEWIVAPNWSNYAKQIVKASEYTE